MNPAGPNTREHPQSLATIQKNIYPKSLVFVIFFTICVLYFVQYNKTNVTSLLAVQQEWLPMERIVALGRNFLIHSCCTSHRESSYLYNVVWTYDAFVIIYGTNQKFIKYLKESCGLDCGQYFLF